MNLHARLLAGLAPWRAAPAWHIALSGGLDSSVLLHLLATLGHTERLPPLNAIHIHHGLQAAADGWPAHCQRLCDGLGVPLRIINVQVAPGASLERAAREARYQAFTQVLGEAEVLLTAQHRDDQAETLLFRLLRGAGVRGLAGIPASRPLGRGNVVRPLLDCSRAELLAYAHEHGLSWVDDPSNADPAYARNHLRHQVFPQFAAHWPQAAHTLARSAAHLREAQGLLDELAELDLKPAQTPSPFAWLNLPSLVLQPLLSLSPERQRNALRHWLAPLTLLPDSEHWAGWLDLRDAGAEAKPVWRLAQGELHREGGRLWWLSGAWLAAPVPPLVWSAPEHPLQLPGNGQLSLQGEAPGGPLQVRYRQGGEVMNLPGRGHRDLKRLLNEQAIPAFVRPRLPLLFRGDELVAVANLPAIRGAAEADWQLQWQAPTNDQRLS
ncbi:tRNA(Ile)-lysidine synthase [Pseudomonas sp. TE3786]